MKRRWTIMTCDDDGVNTLQSELKISRTLCRLLAGRGITGFSEAKQFFRPELSMLHDPFLMKDMDKAVNRIVDAFRTKEKILVFGDYDVDGTTAVALMYGYLRDHYDPELIEFYIPHRYREGYGISKAGIDYAASNGFSLIIALDCGIKSVELIAYAATLQIDFIVCDHHLPGDELPQAAAILNAKQADCNYPYKELCGCGVGFKLISALNSTLGLPKENCYHYLDLVATAIAADIVPITGENRILAYYGLKKINEGPCAGICALLKLAGVQKTVTISNVVFIIAPRVNAAGRMDDAKKAVQLFIERDPAKAMEFAEMLHSDNSDRKDADAAITEEALSLLQSESDSQIRKSSVVFKEGWHKGVVGIVASRLMEHYYRPTIVLTKSGDYVSGSARSVQGFNLYEAIYECRDHLVAYGGHFAAAGLTMLPEQLEPFRKKFNDVVSATIADHLLIPEIMIDSEVQLSEIRESFYNILSQMEPFGPGNMRPVFIARNISDTGHSKIVKEDHLKISATQNNVLIEGIGFNQANLFSTVSRKNFDMVFTLDENEWNGNKRIQAKVIDIRPATY